MRITYLGTASVLLEYAGTRLITDPVFDPEGSTYFFGPRYAPRRWFQSRRLYTSPMSAEQIGAVDAALVSHDHHGDNLDAAGHAYLATPAVATVVTNPAAARRLGAAGGDVRGLAAGESTTIGPVRVTATPALHGPHLTPKVSQITGFALQADGEPSVWISGDTVLSRPLRAAAPGLRGVDVAIIHCGGVRFLDAPSLLNRLRFTFDAAQVVEMCRLIEPEVIIPVHRNGWTHFEPEDKLRRALDGSEFGNRVRWLGLGESTTV